MHVVLLEDHVMNVVMKLISKSTFYLQSQYMITAVLETNDSKNALWIEIEIYIKYNIIYNNTIYIYIYINIYLKNLGLTNGSF
jgi:hypothetical protein